MEIEAPEGKGKNKGQNNNGKTDATENKEEDKASEDEIVISLIYSFNIIYPETRQCFRRAD